MSGRNVPTRAWTAVAATGVGDGAVGSARWIDDDMRAMMLPVTHVTHAPRRSENGRAAPTIGDAARREP